MPRLLTRKGGEYFSEKPKNINKLTVLCAFHYQAFLTVMHSTVQNSYTYLQIFTRTLVKTYKLIRISKKEIVWKNEAKTTEKLPSCGTS